MIGIKLFANTLYNYVFKINCVKTGLLFVYLEKKKNARKKANRNSNKEAVITNGPGVLGRKEISAVQFSLMTVAPLRMTQIQKATLAAAIIIYTSSEKKTYYFQESFQYPVYKLNKTKVAVRANFLPLPVGLEKILDIYSK